MLKQQSNESKHRFKFERVIVSRLLSIDGTQELQFECGHSVILVNPIPDWIDSWSCAQCVYDFVEEHKNVQIR